MRVLPLGERGLLIEIGDVLDPAINAQVRALAHRLAGMPGVEEVVPALRSVLVVVDPLAADPGLIAEKAEAALPALRGAVAEGGRRVEVPVLYGGEAGPDLEEVAAAAGLSVAQAARMHAEGEYTVYMLGFRPGFPYLGVLPEPLRVPRLASPRARVPAGSIGVADALSGIYPLTSPGGWRLIGRTPLSIYDPTAADPILLRPGDRVRFSPIDAATFADPSPPGPLPVPSRPAFAVERAGLYSTIQDGGRIGHRALGVPPSGAMDPLALWAANAAAGNPPDAPALELTAPGPVLRALDDLTVAVAGADLSAAVDGSPVEPATPLRVRRGQRLAFGAPRAGVWAYIAVAGGVEGHRALGSAATFAPGLLGGSGGRRLREGDIVGRGDLPGRPPRLLRPPALPASSIAVRVILGPQDEWLTEEARAAFLKEEYRTSRHGDRAGLRLDGPRLAHREARAFLSDGVLPGAVQVPPDGAPIVLLADGPTTGGYPKIAVVIAADLRLLAQARPGTAVRFRAVAMEEAVDAWRALIGAREGG